MKGSPPLRFLAIVLGGWAAVRTALIAPPWWTPPAGAAPAAAQVRPGPDLHRGRNAPRAPRSELAQARGPTAHAAAIQPPDGGWPGRRQRAGPALSVPASEPAGIVAGATPLAATAPPFRPPIDWLPGPGPGQASPRRWSLSAWAFVRQGDPAPLAAGGLLGGSQAGGRLTYRLNRDSGRPLALSARLSTPLRRAAAAEAALGIDWKPARRLPVHLLAERRQALGREGRSAFAVTIYGGVSELPAGPFRIDAYAQAGMVGARSRDGFADGSLRVSLPLGGRIRFGAGAWAAAQPGLARLDLGPQAALRLPLAGRTATLAADWRLRVAGNAEPGSGPTLTVATDF
jgi:hypothetical protein